MPPTRSALPSGDNTAWAYCLFWFASGSTTDFFMGAEVDYTLP